MVNVHEKKKPLMSKPLQQIICDFCDFKVMVKYDVHLTSRTGVNS